MIYTIFFTLLEERIAMLCSHWIWKDYSFYFAYTISSQGNKNILYYHDKFLICKGH